MFDLFSGMGVALGFIVGIWAHEVAHHVLANRLGDPTPRLHGRLTLRPKAHADPLGSYVLPAVYTIAWAFGHGLTPFGWGKRHSLGARGFRKGRRDAIVISLAGPAATAVVAVIAGVAWDSVTGGDARTVFGTMAIVNASLTVFELLPIPGLDGARILQQFVSPTAAMKIDELAEYKVLFLLVLFLFLDRAADNMLIASCQLLTKVCGP